MAEQWNRCGKYVTYLQRTELFRMSGTAGRLQLKQYCESCYMTMIRFFRVLLENWQTESSPLVGVRASRRAPTIFPVETEANCLLLIGDILNMADLTGNTTLLPRLFFSAFGRISLNPPQGCTQHHLSGKFQEDMP